jgi:predicted porin
MRKSAIQGAVIVGLLSGHAAANAQASGSVTLFGLIDSGVTYVSNEGGSSNYKNDDGILVPNIWGIAGNEDLGGGLHTIFRLVDQFNLGNGTILAGQGLFGRDAFVGLASNRLGTLTFGEQQDFMVDSLEAANNDPAYGLGLYAFRTGPFSKLAIPTNPPFAGSFDWDRMAGGSPIDNAVKYQSPGLGGFSFGGLYGFGGVPGSFGAGSSVSAGLNYQSSSFGAGAAYTQVKYFTAGQPVVGIRNWGVGAHYVFHGLTLQGLITTVRNDFNGGAIAEGTIGADYFITSFWIFSGAYTYMKGNDFLNDNHAHQLSAGIDYVLSKRTVLYAQTIYQRTNSGAQALISGIFDPTGTSSGPNQLVARIGLKTGF